MLMTNLDFKVIELDPTKRYAIILPNEVTRREFDDFRLKLKELDFSRNVILIHQSQDLYIQEIEK